MVGDATRSIGTASNATQLSRRSPLCHRDSSRPSGNEPIAASQPRVPNRSVAIPSEHHSANVGVKATSGFVLTCTSKADPTAMALPATTM